ncbi:MAG TPA: RNA 2',3'-cyclic phosphodiesterase [Candidatus Kapabacteria bacterium]|nr:RNA 2',3'-cyclic phosphodiesterase [Candidatus Kapabacteria bacterium]
MRDQRYTEDPRHTAANDLNRCFYAVTFDAGITAALAAEIAALARHRADVRWSGMGNLHLTLRFLGEIGPDALAEAVRLLESGRGLHPFTLRTRGLGAYPSLRAPRVIWAGVEGEARTDLDHLLALQKQTESWARAIGLPAEQRPYAPHITLGRVARPSAGLQELMNEVITRPFESGFCRIDSVALMRSELRPDGARYTTIAAAGLAV